MKRKWWKIGGGLGNALDAIKRWIGEGMFKVLIKAPMRLAGLILSFPFLALIFVKRNATKPFETLDKLMFYYMGFFKGSMAMKRTISASWNLVKKIVSPFTTGINGFFKWMSGTGKNTSKLLVQQSEGMGKISFNEIHGDGDRINTSGNMKENSSNFYSVSSKLTRRNIFGVQVQAPFNAVKQHMETIENENRYMKTFNDITNAIKYIYSMMPQ